MERMFQFACWMMPPFTRATLRSENLAKNDTCRRSRCAANTQGLNMKRLTPYLIAACAFLGVMAGPQKANADGQIYACVNKSSGETKLVAQNATCKNNDLLVVWNVVGP